MRILIRIQQQLQLARHLCAGRSDTDDDVDDDDHGFGRTTAVPQTRARNHPSFKHVRMHTAYTHTVHR